MPPGPKMAKLTSFSRLSNIASENLHYLGNCYSQANPKTAFEVINSSLIEHDSERDEQI